MRTLELYFDGGNASKLAVFGVVGYCDGREVVRLGGTCDPSLEQTNNVAEWTALRAALVYAYSVRNEYPDVNVYGDSELVVNQFNGHYACAKPHLKPFFQTCKQIEAKLPGLSVSWIPREKNKKADEIGRISREAYLTPA